MIGTSGAIVVGTVNYQSPVPARTDYVNLGPRPEYVVGREEMLGAMRERLVADDTVRTAVLCGLGGVGKTTAALEYA